MANWSDGYTVDVNYTSGYYTELHPLRSQIALLAKGLQPPKITTACELGFGQGVSANIHAAASNCTWYGTDFNPAQAGFAQELARASGANGRFFDQSFAEFAARTDLPDFDFIGLHGIWSWISPENRQIIVDFLRRKLKIGGVVYISYNTNPGWAAFAPIRHLLTQHQASQSAPGQGKLTTIQTALDFAQQVLDTNPTYCKANPLVNERFQRIKDKDRHYLVHEYFNQDWYPTYFSELAKAMQEAKLSFAASAHYLDAVEGIHFSAAQLNVLNSISDPLFRETVREFMGHEMFRRDYWVKGARQLSPMAQTEALRQQSVVLTTPRAQVPLTIQGNQGQGTLNADVYVPLLDALADHLPHTLGELEQQLAAKHGTKGVSLAKIQEAVVLLMGVGHLHPAQTAETTAMAQGNCQRLNQTILHYAEQKMGEVHTLASPVTGGGIGVPRFEQHFLNARARYGDDPNAWIQPIWQLMQQQGEVLVKEGKRLDSDAANLAELNVLAKNFAQKKLPVLLRLQVVV